MALSWPETFAGIAHGATLAAAVMMAGLVAFTALVWLPVSRAGMSSQESLLFCRLLWILLGVLAVAGVVELSLYVVLASDQAFSLGLLWRGLTDTRVGGVWLVRILFASLTVLASTLAAREDKVSYWWAAVGLAGALLMTLTQMSHAAAELRFLPFVADWIHVMAASLWMGGLLGFSALLIGPLRKISAETRRDLLLRAVPRFSRVAMLAVTVVIITGIYASLLHVPSFSALIGTPYGRALGMKLGVVLFMLFIGAINLMDRGRVDSFDTMIKFELVLGFGVFVATGFLTSIPPP